MKPHEQKKIGTKQERKTRRKTNDDKKPNRKRRKDNKTLSQKTKKGRKKLDKKTIKEKEPKIKVLAHELLASTLFYLMLVPW
jgi:hypothetical protein